MVGCIVIMPEVDVTPLQVPRKGTEGLRDQTQVYNSSSPYDQMDKRRQTTWTWKKL